MKCSYKFGRMMHIYFHEIIFGKDDLKDIKMEDDPKNVKANQAQDIP